MEIKDDLGVPASDAEIEDFHKLLTRLAGASAKISDLIFSPGKPPQVELDSKLLGAKVPAGALTVPSGTLTTDDTRRIARLLTHNNPAAVDSLRERGSADVSYWVPDKIRFRVNVFRQRGNYAAVLRVIPNTVPTFDQLQLPPILREIADLRNGIVLVTGPTGSGKSSTMAAIIDLMNDTRSDHIVTIEDPIEFMHAHKKCTIHQREVHSDTPSFALALRAALRQAPKVILVGEMRDLETVEIAFEAAETGHLVLSSLHTIDAAKTVDRIVGIFPKNEEQVVRTRLAATFRFIISQRLLPRAEKGRVAAIEILKATDRTREYIEKGEKAGKSLTDAMNDGGLEGMQSFDKVLEQMARDGTVKIQTALAYATNRNNLILSLNDLPEAHEAALG